MELPQPGDSFDNRYAIDGVLGEGGFAVVYGATDITASRSVALKVLKPRADGYAPGDAARFAREIAIVAQLRNAHTVRVLDSGRAANGLLYAAFEQVPGRDLGAVLTQVGQLEPTLVIHLLRQVLQSLREAHQKGLLHRDLKPENIRVYLDRGDPWFVKLLDFGIARPSDSSHPSITSTGELIGTPRYMSPEQLTEQELTPASDIYALGLVAIELLLGREALAGNRWLDQLDRLASGHLFALGDPDGLDAGLQSILARMTARDPAARFRSATQVLTALAQLDGDHAPEGLVEPLVTEAPRRAPNQVVLAGIGGVAVAVLVAIVAFVVAGSEEKSPSPPAPVVPKPVIRDQATPVVAAPAKPQTGCGREPPLRGEGSLRDSYILSDSSWPAYVPSGYQPDHRYPLVILLHQSDEAARTLLHISGFKDLAEEHGFIVVAPDDGISAWKGTHAEMLRKLRRVHEQAVEQLCIDPRRVYVVGHGVGGEPAELLSCEPWTTAVATNSYRMTRAQSFCDPPVAKPFLMLSPLKSGHEPVEGGKACSGRLKYSIDEVDEMWRDRNHCEGERHETYRKGHSVCYDWPCEVPFESCRLDGGHGWPGSSSRRELRRCDGTPPDFPTAERIWTFFDAAPPLEPGSP